MTSPLMDEIARNIERRMELALMVDKLENAIQRVRKLHVPATYDFKGEPRQSIYCGGCGGCGYMWPCPTLDALDEIDGDSNE